MAVIAGLRSAGREHGRGEGGVAPQARREDGISRRQGGIRSDASPDADVGVDEKHVVKSLAEELRAEFVGVFKQRSRLRIRRVRATERASAVDGERCAAQFGRGVHAAVLGDGAGAGQDGPLSLAHLEHVHVQALAVLRCLREIGRRTRFAAKNDDGTDGRRGRDGGICRLGAVLLLILKSGDGGRFAEIRKKTEGSRRVEAKAVRRILAGGPRFVPGLVCEGKRPETFTSAINDDVVRNKRCGCACSKPRHMNDILNDFFFL